MAVLETHGLGVAWNASLPILKDVSLVLDHGFYGLVGANGAGKTTLLRVLAGELEPHDGKVKVRPASATIAYCPQTIDEPNDDVRALAEAHDGVAAEIKGRLALQSAELDRWPTLSPGERKRWQIGAALAREPDVLLLDEPTNHLDGEARRRLLGALARFRGVGIVVSHDREVLEQLPHAILRVHDAAITMHDGVYSDAKSAWEETRRSREEAHARSKANVRTAERKLDAARRTQEAASRSVSAKSRMKDKNDSDARGMLAKTVARWAEDRAGRTVQVVRDALERAKDDVVAIERDKTMGGHVFATYERAPNPILFHLDAKALFAGPHALLDDVRVTIGREDRVRIAGPNGAGKTTLLSALLASKSTHRDRILHLPQELEPDEIAQLTTDLRELGEEERGRVLSVFSALGSDPERLLRRNDKSSLSPGEARKLALAMGLGRHAWALVLDEPTNHLDLPTIERLEKALRTFPGAIILVTHDEAFAQAVATKTLRIEGRSVL